MCASPKKPEKPFFENLKTGLKKKKKSNFFHPVPITAQHPALFLFATLWNVCLFLWSYKQVFSGIGLGWKFGRWAFEYQFFLVFGINCLPIRLFHEINCRKIKSYINSVHFDENVEIEFHCIKTTNLYYFHASIKGRTFTHETLKLYFRLLLI